MSVLIISAYVLHYLPKYCMFESIIVNKSSMTADACANNNYKRRFEKDVLKRRYKESVKKGIAPYLLFGLSCGWLFLCLWRRLLVSLLFRCLVAFYKLDVFDCSNELEDVICNSALNYL